MKYGDHVASLRRESESFASAWVRRPDAPVPGCPGWDAKTLASHLGGVHGFWAVQVRAADPEQRTQGPPPEPNPSPAWLAERSGELLDVLRKAEPGRPCWNWSGVNLTAAWVARRMANETSVHRWDAQSAVGDPSPLDPMLAADGIDELVDVFLDAPPGTEPGDAPVLGLQAADLPLAWTLAVTGDGVVRVTGGSATTRVAGPAGELLLLLWGRGAGQNSTVSTDGRALDAWRAIARFD